MHDSSGPLWAENYPTYPLRASGRIVRGNQMAKIYPKISYIGKIG